ncbi:MAG: hypothetical protein GTO62_20175, partial [Planctomycetales bacterium]|nr:hypothetical protein [Planctomycetales bacterium]NIP71477.1 hypothetical protein [Planctomycetales bacterium]
MDSFFFLLTGLALIVLRVRRPTAERPVRVPAYPAVPLLFAAGEIAILIGAFLDKDYRNGAWIGAV